MKKQNFTRTKFQFLHYLLLAFACLALIFSVNAYAEEAAQKENYDDYKFDEMEVTSSKRPQKLQEVPVSIFAVPGDVLEHQGIDGLGDLSAQVAGMEIIDDGGGDVTLSARGVGNLESSGTSLEMTSVVGYYIDELPISSLASGMPDMAMFDIERVEILRGPQGTLFGEGSMAGVVRIITKKPDSSEFSSRIATEISKIEGGGTNFSLKGMLNAPIIKDKLAIRLQAGKDHRDGWIDVPDLDAQDTNSSDSIMARIAFRFTPSDELTIDYSTYHQTMSIDNDTGESSWGVYNPFDIPFLGSGIWEPFPVFSMSTVDIERTFHNLTISYDFGVATLVTATSYFQDDRISLADLNPSLGWYIGDSPMMATTQTVANYQPEDYDIDLFSQELRLVSNGDKMFDWTVGAFYKESSRYAITGFSIYALDLGFPYDSIETNVLDATNDAWAVFADVDYEFLEQFSIGVGARYYEDKREYNVTATNTGFPFVMGPAGVSSAKGEDDSLTGKVVLNWKPNNDLLLFVKATQGFRSGGTNPGSFDFPGIVPEDYQAENLTAYEIGMKSNLFPGLTLNAYAYLNEWEDMQLSFLHSDGLLTVQYDKNAASASAMGVELEVIAALPIEGLSINFSGAYTETGINDNVYDEDGITILARKDNEIQGAPKFKYNIGAQYAMPVTDTLFGVIRATYSHKDGTYVDSANTEAWKTDSYDQVSASVALEAETWNIQIFVDNLIDRDDLITQWESLSGMETIHKSYVRPRTIGLRMSINF